jgi:hypothetical protein
MFGRLPKLVYHTKRVFHTERPRQTYIQQTDKNTQGSTLGNYKQSSHQTWYSKYPRGLIRGGSSIKAIEFVLSIL